MPGYIWMNVSSSLNWSRAAVGIVRVELELASALSLLYKDRFQTCVFEDGDFKPCSVKFSVDEILADYSREADRIGFPQISLLEPGLLRIKPRQMATIRQNNSPRAIGPGDVLITVGLDWELDSQKLNDALSSLRHRLNVVVVTCCYDLVPILFPEFCLDYVPDKFNFYLLSVIKNSSLVLCISKNTEKDLIAYAAMRGLKISQSAVFRLGSSSLPSKGIISELVMQISKSDFIIYVSTIEIRKNHKVLLDAYRILLNEGSLDRVPKMIFVGMAGWGVEKILNGIADDSILREKIIILNHVTDIELNRLYCDCKFCVYPSFYEGWGLPIAEALSYGKVVLASPTSAIPEVGGEIVQYIDPMSPRIWAESIKSLSSSPSKLRDMEEQIKRTYVLPTWEGAARDVKNEIDKIMDLTDKH